MQALPSAHCLLPTAYCLLPSAFCPLESRMSVIETRALRKHYGRIEALRGVTLAVERGEIFGLLGQNGAGKTTLIKVLLGIAWKTEGDAFLLGEVSGSVNVRQRV